jgi:hypothetical protein
MPCVTSFDEAGLLDGVVGLCARLRQPGKHRTKLCSGSVLQLTGLVE